MKPDKRSNSIFPLRKVFTKLKSFVLKDSLLKDSLMEALFEKMQEGVIVCDKKGKILYSNQRVSSDIRQNYFQSFGELDNFLDIEWNAYDEAGRKLQNDELPLYRVLVGEELEDQELWIRPPGKPPVLLSVRGKRLTGQSGQLLGAVVIYRDLTEERKAQDKIKSFLETNSRTKQYFGTNATANSMQTDGHRQHYVV